MNTRTTDKKQTLTIFLGAVVCSFCHSSFGELNFEQENFYMEKHLIQQITPVKLMNNETLFLAAKADRDNSMEAHQRVANRQWMVQSFDNTTTGNEALLDLIKSGALAVWKTHSAKSQAAKDISNTEDAKAKKYSLTNLDNYEWNTDTETETISLSFRYAF